MNISSRLPIWLQCSMHVLMCFVSCRCNASNGLFCAVQIVLTGRGIVRTEVTASAMYFVILESLTSGHGTKWQFVAI